MLDYNTVILFGWKVTKNQVDKLRNELEVWDEDYYDKIQNIIIEDTMCGNYIYFGAILVKYDARENNEVVINTELISKKTDLYNNIIKENPELSKILDKYKNGDPQLYVFQNIW